MSWKVTIKKKQLKALEKLPARIQEAFLALESDLATNGPVQPGWQNYSKLGENKHHCHLSYRYVACWTAEEKTITIEVYYVGSREKAPY